MLRLPIFVLLAVLCQTGFTQEEFPFREPVFQGASGYRPGENFEYFLTKRGFFRGVGADEESAIIAEWTRKHPGAKAIPVSVVGEKSRLPIVYFWAVDGEDNLNLLLVRQGVYPALVMLDTVQYNQLLLSSKDTPYGQTLEAMEHAGNSGGATSRRLVSESRYEDFLKQLVAAETAAQAELNGIWSDKFKSMRHKIGIIPLSAMPR